MKYVILISFLALCLFLGGSTVLGAEKSAIVERHLFTPEAPSKEPPKEQKKEKRSPLIDQIKRELDFTGIIITPKVKKVMIHNKRRRKGDGDYKDSWSEGEEINGIQIKSIHSNHVILAKEDEEVPVYLFRDQPRHRPAPIPEPVEPKTEPSAATQASKQKKDAGKTSPNAKTAPPKSTAQPNPITSRGKKQNKTRKTTQHVNPFLEALKKRTQKANEAQKSTHRTASPAATNPFIEAIKRAQEMSQNQ